LITTNTTYDEIPMPNSTSAYDIVSYANNVKSTLKRTISCDSDEKSIVTSINDFYLTEENLSQGKLQITINYNALEEYLEISFLQLRDLTMASSIELSHVRLYILVWLDQDRKQSQQSQSIPYEKNPLIPLNASMKWKVIDDHLPCTVLRIHLYARENNLNEILLGECSFTIGEIYIYQPLTTWLNLYPSDQVISDRKQCRSSSLNLFSSSLSPLFFRS